MQDQTSCGVLGNLFAGVAQTEEQRSTKPRVGGSIPSFRASCAVLLPMRSQVLTVCWEADNITVRTVLGM